ncbi:MAG TPA: FtsX-like permease family protein [Acidobacteriota bacterium]|nr:FtsX-like permease family protein [Acidobacteriota bacterium]
MSFESYIARRYFSSGRYFISVSTWITIVGVTLGVAVVCFVMSMHNGFEAEIRSRLLGTTSHISVFPLGDPYITDYRQVVRQLETADGVLAASPFIYSKAAIQSASTGDGIIVRGIDPDLERRTANIADDIKLGTYTFEEKVINGDTLPGIILGRGLAGRLGVFIAQPVVLYSMSGEDLQRNSRPRVKKFYVSALFETGMFEFDGQQAYISLTDAQELFRVGDAVTAVHLKLTDIYRASELAPVIDSLLGFQYDIVPWNVLHQNLFSWIAFEKKILFLGFILIVIVAAFSIISTLVMLTMEKRAEIGILKTLGTTPRSVRRIFVYKGLLIALLGMLGGWGLALLAAYVQNRFRLISLPADIYFISYLPIETHLVDFVLAGLATFLICYLAALYPAGQAARLSVIEVLRE